jgi:hypothetical protein
MTRDERQARYRAEVAAIAGARFGHVVFEDRDAPGRVVQVSTGLGDEPAVVEATPSYDGELARLTPYQRAGLAALGFDVTAEPYPRRLLSSREPMEAIDLFEPSFIALGSTAGFRLGLISAQNDSRAWADPA